MGGKKEKKIGAFSSLSYDQILIDSDFSEMTNFFFYDSFSCLLMAGNISVESKYVRCNQLQRIMQFFYLGRVNEPILKANRI